MKYGAIMWLSTNGTQHSGGDQMGAEVNLRGIVVSKFGSVANFAKAIGWGYSKTNRIVGGRQEPDVEDIKQMARCLEINDPQAIVSIFLS